MARVVRCSQHFFLQSDTFLCSCRAQVYTILGTDVICYGKLGTPKAWRVRSWNTKALSLVSDNRTAFSRGRTTGNAIDGDGVGRG